MPLFSYFPVYDHVKFKTQTTVREPLFFMEQENDVEATEISVE